jgi:Arm DNA-binding domain
MRSPLGCLACPDYREFPPGLGSPGAFYLGEQMLTDTKIRSLRPRGKPYQRADGGGLVIEVLPGGKKVWRGIASMGSKRR